MSEQDSFINEVSDEVRRDKLFALFRRYGWIAALLIVILVGGATWNEWRKARERNAAQAIGDAILSAMDAEDAATRAANLSDLVAEDDSARRALLRLLAANAEVEAGNTDGAAALLDAVSADEAAPPLYRDLATLKSVIIDAPRTAPEQRIARLDRLAQPNAPFRLLALEQIAIAQVEAGQRTEALETLRGLLAEPGVTQGLRRRVSQLIVSLGGTISAG